MYMFNYKNDTKWVAKFRKPTVNRLSKKNEPLMFTVDDYDLKKDNFK